MALCRKTEFSLCGHHDASASQTSGIGTLPLWLWPPPRAIEHDLRSTFVQIDEFSLNTFHFYKETKLEVETSISCKKRKKTVQTDTTHTEQVSDCS